MCQVRIALLEAGNRLFRMGVILDPDDVFFLKRDELMVLLLQEDKYEIKLDIKARRKEYLLAKRMNPPKMIINGVPNEEQYERKRLAVVKGRCASAGIAKGYVYVITNPLDTKTYCNIPRGSIAIASVLTPWIANNLIAAKAIVTEEGGFLSHGAILAREMNIPAIVGADNATQTFKTGDYITVNATNGEILISKAEDMLKDL